MATKKTNSPFSSSPQNLIAQSQSGTGKTAAFVLAMLSHVDPNNRYPQVSTATNIPVTVFLFLEGVYFIDVVLKTLMTVLALTHLALLLSLHQCLCVSPTYELALQTGKVIEQMGKHYPEVRLVYAIRGNKCKWFAERVNGSCQCKLMHVDVRLTSDCFIACVPVQRGSKLQEQIVIGTPGTMLDWCSKFKFIDPKKIKVFVLDEADVMIATQGHQDQSIRIQRSVGKIQNRNTANLTTIIYPINIFLQVGYFVIYSLIFLSHRHAGCFLKTAKCCCSLPRLRRRCGTSPSASCLTPTSSS